MADSSNESLLQVPCDYEYPSIERLPSHYNPLHTFDLPKGEKKHYQQQYADMYFLRLAQLKPAVEELAAAAWSEFEVGGEKVRKVDRVLDVRQGDVCWVAGTIYMDMPLKPNILDDIAKDHMISVPPSREKYRSASGEDLIMLEDESGRLRLIGMTLQSSMLVTGCIVAVMGSENADGDFEIIDLKVPDLPHQPPRWERDDNSTVKQNGTGNKSRQGTQQDRPSGGKIAIVSGLGISGDEVDSLTLDLLMEYLLGEACGVSEGQKAASISRLIIAGNALDEAVPLLSRDDLASKKSNKKYGYDSAAYNPAPTAHLDNFLATLLPSIPITLIPGDSDPANVSLPQQPMHTALFPRSRAYSTLPDSKAPRWFDSTTNPWQGDIDGWRFMGTGGQPVDDIFKYVEGDDRIEMMENLLRWRCAAPTAPDTLCKYTHAKYCNPRLEADCFFTGAYPYQEKDQFVITECPHVYFVGNQPKFDTTVIEGPDAQSVRLIAVPKFKETGELILLDADTLEVETIKFDSLDDGSGF
ncbi:MAG: hypothetical protein MMC33_007172 [Icmadophila ericetorum]|nr:hypothetical protein [Icmadophila ericetorum]